MTKTELKKQFFKKYDWAKEAYKNLGLYYDPVNFLIYKSKETNDITFAEYLELNEHKLLKPTNIYEMIRFRTCNGDTCIMYQGKGNIRYSNDLTKEIYQDWKISKKKKKKCSNFPAEKKLLIEYIESINDKYLEKLYKFISSEMQFTFNKNKIEEINDIKELKMVYKLVKQFRETFIQS
tara:strand:+ start:964 stop:1500 length:537 start_codon:yes stop_codon:yes gene_type:complete